MRRPQELSPKKSVIGAFTLLIVAGCVTEQTPESFYRPAGSGPDGGFGWSQIANSDGTVTLKFKLPEQVGADGARVFWDRRARQICGHGNYKKTIYRTERGYGSNNYNYTTIAYGYIYEGYLDCKTQTPAKP